MPPTPSCDSQATGGSKNARNVLRVSCLDSLSKIYLFLRSPQWPAGFTPSHAIAEKNLALLSGGGREACDPLLRLAGHWWEQKRSKRAASLMSGFFVEDLLVFELPPVACRFHAVAEENLAWLRGVQLGTADPLYRRDLRLAGHWWEPSGAHRGCARRRQDSAFSETWCCTNGVGASQATGESFFKQILGMKVNS